MIADQELAGLDILTNGDYHLDFDLAGRSWFSYPSERVSGISEYDTERTALWDYPVGTWLNEIVGGWKYHAIVDKIGPRVPLEFAKIWRVAQARTEKPVKFGTVSSDLACTVLTIQTDAYDDDKRELMWDLATILNAELRQLVAGGCKVVQIEEPAIHSAAAWGADEDTLNFYVDLFNHTVEGLDDAEVWVHTCWGNPGAQHCFDPNISYEPSLEIYMERIKCDVWTIESKNNNHQLLPALAPYKGTSDKKIAVGMHQPPPAPGGDARRGRGRHPARAGVHRAREPRALVRLRLRPPGRAAADRDVQGRRARAGREHRPQGARRRDDVRADRRPGAPDRHQACPRGRTGLS